MSGDFWRRLGLPWLGRADAGEEFDDELAHHIEMRAAELAGTGLDQDEARRRARAEFGDITRTRERYVTGRGRRVRRDRRGRWAAELGQDLRLGLRQLRRYPSFAAVAVLTLSLGIGVNTAAFTVLSSVLLRPLPYPDPDGLVRVWGTNEETGDAATNLSPPDVLDLAERSTSLEALAAFSPSTAPLTGRGDATVVNEVLAMPSIFRVLRVSPALGRGFTDEEARPDGPLAVVLSHRYWSRAMGADPAVLGTTLTVEHQPHTIVGVLPPGWILPTLAVERQPEILRPLRLTPQNGRGGRWLRAVGRLAEGVSPVVADQELSAIAASLMREYPESNTAHGTRVQSLKDATVGDASDALWVLQAAVLLVLLIACANVANLMLVRGSTRGTELAVRRAVGAGRGRLARQLLAEGAVLAALGGAGGLLLAVWATRTLASVPGAGIPRASELGLDLPVVLFCTLLSLGAGLTAALAPLAQALRGDVRASLTSSGTGQARSGRRLRDTLVAGEAALALVLLVGAGLLIRSFGRLVGEDAGVDTAGTHVVEVVLPADEYGSRAAIGAFYAEWVPLARALPGVDRLGAVNNLPFLYDSCDGFRLPDRPDPGPGQRPCASNQLTTPGYFEAAGIGLVEGRDFTPADRADAPPVAIVNQAFAERFWPDGSAVGERVSYNGIEREIVGVSRSVRRLGLAQEPPPEMFIPHAQDSWERQMFLVVRASGDPGDVVARIRASLAAADPDVPVGRVLPLERLVSGTVAEPRFRTATLGAFALLALVLAGIGIYGVMAHSVAQRTRELGVRIALGADRRRVRRLVVGDGLRIVTLGLLAGGAASVLAVRFLTSLLYETAPFDPVSAGTAAALLLGVALLGSYLPARRAAAADPLEALRGD